MKRFTLALVIALMAVASIVSVAGAQIIRDKTLIFSRIDAASTPIGYATPFSDGNHPAAGKGIAVAPQDTAIVDISDHFYRFMPNILQPFPGAGAAGDSVWLGTLTIEGSTSTIDTVKFFRDVSPDGWKWTLVDSAVTHITSSEVASAIIASAGDSVRAILATSNDPSAVGKKAVITLFTYPAMASGGVTPLALKDVNFIRFRIAMSPGDFAAAGTTNGLRAAFRYPAVKNLPPTP